MEFIFKYKKLFATLFWTCIIIIVTFSVIPNGPKMELNINDEKIRLDYFLHFSIYFTLPVLYFFWKADRYLKIKPALITYFIIGSFMLAGLSEYVQTFIPGRTFNPVDFFSNVAGIMLGIILCKIVFRNSNV